MTPAPGVLEAGWDELRGAPRDQGHVELLVVRPAPDRRETPARVGLSPGQGVEGDDWHRRPAKSSPDGGPHPERQVTLISARLLRLLAPEPERWPLAGDQLVVDLDLGQDNLAPGDRLEIGDAVLAVTAEPHTGCQKFAARYGAEALRFVNSPEGRHARLRGLYARVVEAGTVAVGDSVAVARVGEAAPSA